MRIYVGNLSWGSTEEDISQFFSAWGDVTSVAIIVDRETGRSRGFGFVEMSDSDGARAIAEGNGKPLDGRPLRINEAQERQRGGGGGRGGDRPPRPRRD